MDDDRDRGEWTDEKERHPEGDEKPMPVQEEGLAVGLEAVDEQDPDLDPQIAAEVQLQEETREAEEEFGPIEDAVEDPADDG
ncbi:MAG: hypothetical protein WBZ00_15495 [Solirubrobacterales bacterium]|jgi:hypothetical protein